MSNIKIVEGAAIPVPKGRKTSYSYSFIEFKDMECRNFNYNPELSANHGALISAMFGKQQLLWIKSIGTTGGFSISDDASYNKIDKTLLNNLSEQYKDIPCATISVAGTIIPQIIVPSEQYKYLPNGLTFTPNGGTQINNEAVNYGFNWNAKQISEIDEQGNIKYVEGSGDLKIYGERDHGVINNSNATKPSGYKNKKTHATRSYECTLVPGADRQPGSCAICYKIIYHDKQIDGETEEEKKISPSLKIEIGTEFKTTEYDESDVESSDSTASSISIEIPPRGEIKAVVSSGTSSNKNNQITQGSFSTPSNNLMPPQCTKIGDEYNVFPVYVYPLYSGIGITNTVIGNNSVNESGMFIQYNNNVRHVSYIAKVNGVAKSSEMKSLIKQDSGSELLNWFPALFQECASKEGITIELPEQSNLKFGDKVSVTWTKAVGKFAYCPIFFHRKIQLTLYFKGEYVGDKAAGYVSSVKYYVYPLVYSNIKAASEDSEGKVGWTGLTKKGATCITNVRLVCSDKTTQESIYAVNLEFTAKEIQRYPIELLGLMIVYENTDFKFKTQNGNGTFSFQESVIEQFSGLLAEQKKHDSKKYLALLSHVSVSGSLEGVSGSFTMDGYPLTQGIKKYMQPQSIGEMDLAVQKGDDKSTIFRGYGMQLSTSDSENNYSINGQLYGINRKMEDMKLICAPFWDGDRLEVICAYFEAYLQLKIKMIDSSVKAYANAKPVSYSTLNSSTGTWKASDETSTVVNSITITHPDFRVPRSSDWRSPMINFTTGTACLEALKTLGVKTGCVCVPQLDGTIVFYELNKYGFPYYIWNQSDSNVVSFSAHEIISISLSPSLEHKFNAIATFGFLTRKEARGKDNVENNVQHGAFYTRTGDGSFNVQGANFPWQRASIGVESAMLTRPELLMAHKNRVKMMSAEIYTGTMTVPGNGKVNHMYQRIKVCGINFFVVSIDHDVDLSGKIWTTSYGIQYINVDNKGNKVKYAGENG